MNDGRQLTCLSDVIEKPLTYLWDGFLAEGMVTLLFGDGGQGKSRVGYDLIARLTSGRPMPLSGETRPPAGAVLIQAEDPMDCIVKPTLVAAGADISRVRVYEPLKFGSRPLVLPKDLPVVGDAVRDVRAKLIVVDPVAAFVNCNQNSEASVRAAIGPIAEFAQDHCVAVVLVRHCNKSRNAIVTHQASGSACWIAIARIVVKVEPDPTAEDDHQYLFRAIKTNLPSAPALAYRTALNDGLVLVEWQQPCPAAERILASDPGEEGTRISEAAETLFLILRSGPRRSEDVYTEARKKGVAKRTLQRAKKKLGAKHQRIDGPWGQWSWSWYLSENDNSIVAYFRQKYAHLDAASTETADQAPPSPDLILEPN